MEPRPLTLTLALALLLSAHSPLPSHSSPLLRLHSPLSSPSGASSPPLSSPSPSHPLPPPPPPLSPPRLVPNPNGLLQPPPGKFVHHPPPGTPCKPGSSSCQRDRHRWRGHSPREPRRAVVREERKLNLGKKVGLAFVAVAAVLQLLFGGFLIYGRWHIRKIGYEREVASPPPCASSSAT